MARGRRKPLPRRKGPISLGDVVLASAALQPRDEPTRAMIAGLLGFEIAPVFDVGKQVGPWKPIEGKPGTPDVDVLPPPPMEPPRTIAAVPRLVGVTAQSTLVRRTRFEPPSWVHEGGEAFRPAAGSAESVPPPPLFAPSRARALLSATLSTSGDGAEIDVDRAIRAKTGGSLLDRIPYRQVLTLRRGAQLLVDRATAMDPYGHDVDGVELDLRRLVGRGRLQRLEFSHCPSRGVRRAKRRGREPWRSPGRGVPVLVVSDLGLGAPLEDKQYATASEWLAFARAARQSGSPLVALVPFPPLLWPDALSRAMTLVFWSERTTVRQVVKVLRDARRSAEERR